MDQMTQKMAEYKLSCAEDFVWDAKVELAQHPDLLSEATRIIDLIYDMRVNIRAANVRTIEDFDEEPYEKSEKDCMWERE